MYENHLDRLNSYVKNLEQLLYIKNLDELDFFLKRSDTLSELYNDNEDFINEIKIELKEKKLGTSLNDVITHIAANAIMLNIENIIEEDIFLDNYENYQPFDKELTQELYVKSLEAVESNSDDERQQGLKFLFQLLFLTKACILSSDKKLIDQLPINKFKYYTKNSKTSYLTEDNDINLFYERNKTKSRISILKLFLPEIKSRISNAISRLSRV